MKLVTGGSFQGKYQYARRTFGIEDGWVDGDTCSWNEIFACRGILHFQDYVQRRLRAGKEVSRLAEELLEKNPDVCIVTNEMGCGVVPADAFDRKYRETLGRICEKLAAGSEEVHRVICGIGTVIKHA
jgi:adenosylcobinamide kinase/adenosylcobinamide-phosphate guanylyltransferase